MGNRCSLRPATVTGGCGSHVRWFFGPGPGSHGTRSHETVERGSGGFCAARLRACALGGVSN